MKRLLFPILLLGATNLFAQYNKNDYFIEKNAPANAGINYSGTPVLGDIIYFNGTNWVSLGKPADGTYSIKFTSSIPSWQAGGSGLPSTGSTGLVAETVSGSTTAARTIVCADTYCSLTNGNGVSGNPSIAFAITPGHEGGAVALQSSSPGTQQGSAGSGNINVNGAVIQELDGLAATPTVGITQQNTTASTGVTTAQLAPHLTQCGTAWNSGGSASETDCWRIRTVPVTAAGTTTNNLVLDVSTAGAAYTNGCTFGKVSGTGATVTCVGGWSGNLTMGSANSILQLNSQAGGTGGIQATAGSGGSDLYTSATTLMSGLSGASVDSSSPANILQAGSAILAVTYRITTTIAGSGTTGFQIGDSSGSAATRFCGTQSTLTANTTGVCLAATGTSASQNPSALNLRVTAVGGNFTSGAIRIQVYQIVFTPPTS